MGLVKALQAALLHRLGLVRGRGRGRGRGRVWGRVWGRVKVRVRVRGLEACAAHQLRELVVFEILTYHLLLAYFTYARAG